MITTVTTAQVAAETLCVVYDGQTGVISHFHHSITLEGGRKPSDVALRAETLALTKDVALTLRNPAPDLTRLEVLTVRPEEIDVGAQYRVNVSTRQLVRQSESTS
jgi:hypothetical protein